MRTLNDAMDDVAGRQLGLLTRRQLIELGTTTPTLTAITGIDRTTTGARSFTTAIEGVQTAFLVTANADTGSGRYWTFTGPTSVAPALQFTGSPFEAIRVR